jgi:hypothetical protein
MSKLRGIALKASYHKGTDDIAADFYLPCVSASTHYDRAVVFLRF